MKWHSNDDEEFRVLAGRYALDFLKSMNGTLCYLMVAFRMLAKAPWTARMVCAHIRQAAIYAISRGWFLNTVALHGIHFSRTELALAAGTFLGDLKPNLPDDTDQPLFLLIHELPHICADLFSTGSAVCKSCGRSKAVPIPTFATAISWASTSWESLKHCLERDCTPFPGQVMPLGTKVIVRGMTLISLTSMLVAGPTCPLGVMKLKNSLHMPLLLIYCEIGHLSTRAWPFGRLPALMFKMSRLVTSGSLKLKMANQLDSMTCCMA